MGDDMRLTKEIAEDLKSINLSKFTHLDDDAAEVLGNHEGCLDLSGLMSLSKAAAKAPGKHSGDLILKNITSLSDTAAEALAEHLPSE